MSEIICIYKIAIDDDVCSSLQIPVGRGAGRARRSKTRRTRALDTTISTVVEKTTDGGIRIKIYVSDDNECKSVASLRRANNVLIMNGSHDTKAMPVVRLRVCNSVVRCNSAAMAVGVGVGTGKSKEHNHAVA